MLEAPYDYVCIQYDPITQSWGGTLNGYPTYSQGPSTTHSIVFDGT
jgi:hypothetical protein